MHPRQNASEHIIIATANVHFGDAIRLDGGLDSLRDLAPDILMLQEVTNSADELVRQLKKDGYDLIHFAPEYGLAIAIHASSKLSVVPNSTRTYELQKMSAIEYRMAQRFAKLPHKMNAHGLQMVRFEAEDGQILTVANTRTTVSSNRFDRRKQVARMGELFEPILQDALIVGGDMNHFPGPQRADIKMCQKAGLRRVDLASEPTWHARNSKLYRKIARLRRKPIEELHGELDALLYRGELELASVKVVDILSDHRAIVGEFAL